jgi:hypothetical protein
MMSTVDDAELDLGLHVALGDLHDSSHLPGSQQQVVVAVVPAGVSESSHVICQAVVDLELIHTHLYRPGNHIRGVCVRHIGLFRRLPRTCRQTATEVSLRVEEPEQSQSVRGWDMSLAGSTYMQALRGDETTSTLCLCICLCEMPTSSNKHSAASAGDFRQLIGGSCGRTPSSRHANSSTVSVALSGLSAFFCSLRLSSSSSHTCSFLLTYGFTNECFITVMLGMGNGRIIDQDSSADAT